MLTENVVFGDPPAGTRAFNRVDVDREGVGAPTGEWRGDYSGAPRRLQNRRALLRRVTFGILFVWLVSFRLLCSRRSIRRILRNPSDRGTCCCKLLVSA